MSEFVLSTDDVREVVDAARARELCADLSGPLATVRLSGKSLTLPAAEVVAERLVDVSGLIHLDIADIIASRPEDEAKSVLAAIASASPASELKTLDVSDNALGLKGVRVLAPLLSSSRQTLTEFSCCNNGLEGRAARLMALLLTMKSASAAIDAVPTPSRDDNESTLNEIIPEVADELNEGISTSLTRFHTFNNLLENAGARAFSRLLHCSPHLVDVRIASTRIGPEGAMSIASGLANSTTLKSIDFSDNSFGPSGCSMLFEKVIAKQSYLETLRLAAVGMEDEGLVALSAALNESKAPLKVLDLSCNEITPEAADDLASLLKSLKSTIGELKLAENELGSTGIAVSIPSIFGSGIYHLDLSVNELSDSGAIAFSKVIGGLDKLKNLQLNGNMIGARGRAAIHEALKTASKLETLGEMDLNDDEYEEQEEDADDDRIAAALEHLHL